MSEVLIPFFLVLILISAFLRDSFVLTLLYLFAGLVYFSHRWGERALRNIRYTRHMPLRAFHGEEIQVGLELRNAGWLPLVWAKVSENLPAELSQTGSIHQIITLPARGSVRFTYALSGRRRGYYPIGPLTLSSSDVFGLGGDYRQAGAPDYLTIFPKIIPLHPLNLPSIIPLGTLPYKQPVFEDPNRVVGKRDYVVGDSLRRVDWKSSAVAGRLQVKVYEPSISLESMVFLGLHPDEYFRKLRYDSMELAIVVAASLANWISERRQAVGLAASGVDPLSSATDPGVIPARKGRGHLLRILETLARLRYGRRRRVPEVIQQASVHLPWGTTLIVIAGKLDELLFDELLRARRRGQPVQIILVGMLQVPRDWDQKARLAGMALHTIYREADLQRWGGMAW